MNFDSLNCGGQLIELRQPKIMGILNVTPDSFFDGGKWNSKDAALQQAEQMLKEGATFLDIGGMSSRPGAEAVSVEEELRRVLPVVEAIHEAFPQAVISVDTYRSKVAKEAVAAGAQLINDISAGRFDEDLLPTVAELKVPYILMHMQGTPKTMQQQPQYTDLIQDLYDFFIEKTQACKALGIEELLLDVGFGFGKTVAHNYALLQNMRVFESLGYPILAGVSRKSMICKTLKCEPASALNGTTALHVIALQQGAKILRVHDVAPAQEVLLLWQQAEAQRLTTEQLDEVIF